MNKIANITHRIFYDNKILMIFSFITAVIIWLVVAISLSPTDTAVIKDVPVTIDLANSVPDQFNLEIFGQSDFTVDVEITGKRYIVNASSINKNSVKVVAQTAYVDSAGKHTLSLKATKANDNDEYEITSISEDHIEVYFDVYMEKDFPIEAKLNVKDKTVEDGYVSGTPMTSSDTVTVSGPATEVNSISNVYAELNIDKPLTQTRSDAAEINAYTESGGILHNLSYNFGNADVTVTVPVYLNVDKPTSVTFKNSPSAYIEKQFSYTVSPSQLKAGVQGITDEKDIDSINVAAIDFADLKPGTNKFTVNADSIQSVLVPNSKQSFVVTVNVNGCQTKTLTVPNANISYINAPEGYEVKSLVSSIGSVTVVGPESTVDDVSASDIFAVIDLSDADASTSTQKFAAKLSVKNSTDCWVYGKYTVTARH